MVLPGGLRATCRAASKSSTFHDMACDADPTPLFILTDGAARNHVARDIDRLRPMLVRKRVAT